MITINKPYIVNNGNVSRLCSDIEENHSIKTMYFEVQNEYAKYLCDETADAFLVGLLNYAFQKGEDITSIAPINERLLYQLTMYYLPTMSQYRKKYYQPITINAVPYIDKIKNAGGVGTSASGGVDSFYSIVKHTSLDAGSFRLTHLLIANQFNYYPSEEQTREQFEELVKNTEKIPANYGLKLVSIYTNHYEFMFDGFIQEYTMRICSYAFALQKLFSVYYVSSGETFGTFSFNSHDSDGFDIFNLPMLSTDDLTFYSSGGEVGRTEKIKAIAQDQFVQKNIKVCNFNNLKNCSKCEKCMRTMLSLDMIGQLENFNCAFETNNFYRKKKHYLADVFSGKVGAAPDLIDSIKRFSYPVPLLSKLYGRTIVKSIWIIKQKLKNIKLLRKIYFALKIDYLIYGREQAEIYRFGNNFGLNKGGDKIE